MGDRIINHTSNLIEMNVINTEAPDKVFDITHMLLMRLGSKKDFE